MCGFKHLRNLRFLQIDGSFYGFWIASVSILFWLLRDNMFSEVLERPSFDPSSIGIGFKTFLLSLVSIYYHSQDDFQDGMIHKKFSIKWCKREKSQFLTIKPLTSTKQMWYDIHVGAVSRPSFFLLYAPLPRTPYSFSHGLKTCHRHVFLTAFRFPYGKK